MYTHIYTDTYIYIYLHIYYTHTQAISTLSADRDARMQALEQARARELADHQALCDKQVCVCVCVCVCVHVSIYPSI